MAYVQVPKDLTRVKTKVMFNLTRRQLICFGLAGVVGVPVYLLARGTFGTTFSACLMVVLMLPFFFFAMYEKDGRPFEKILMNICSVRRKRLCIFHRGCYSGICGKMYPQSETGQRKSDHIS